ncbi:MAG: hypothetical protein JJU46_06880 [Balneolaceae bacterium]|nr:hypothetical protein [Balneolaceae bacterium]MCH8548267.1 hypothetical protein [Balneolaceae bacterium]
MKPIKQGASLYYIIIILPTILFHRLITDNTVLPEQPFESTAGVLFVDLGIFLILFILFKMIIDITFYRKPSPETEG